MRVWRVRDRFLCLPIRASLWLLPTNEKLNRCHLKGAQGDALHVLGCAAGDNLLWLLRWIACLRAWLQVVRARFSTRSSIMWPPNMAFGV
ncbi:hypothetical protein FE36_20545 [Xanthomonas oryzae pv. oryzicola]|nr:hypothetical protein FE36_20545 [Xanthomonas oryzae pv. oryzicola]